MKPFVVAANWKMYKSPSEAVDFIKNFLPKATALPAHRKIIIFPPAVDLWVVELALRGTTVGWGAQNCYFEKEGAFTGETSPSVLAEMGASYSLVGHSERRTLFGETDEMTARKVGILHELNITPMLCVGETLKEREAGQTADVIKRQLHVGLSKRVVGQPVIIAYEPVWAIGTGKVATPEQANEAHVILRKELVEIGGKDFADATPILYGGSVKPENAKEIGQQPEVDGFLVGGASLEPEKFAQLANLELN